MILQSGKNIDGVGGLDRYYRELLRELEDRQIGYRAFVGGALNQPAPDSQTVTTFPTDGFVVPRLWSTNWRARRLLEDASIDLVVAHFAMYALPLIRRLGDRPFVVHFHGPWAMESKYEGDRKLRTWIKHRFERRVYQRASHLITLSEAFAKVLVDDYSVPRERIRVIPGGVDVERFNVPLSRADARARLGWPKDRPTFVTVRRLVKRMGLSTFIEAIALLRRQHPDVHVQICGRGKLQDELAMQIKALGLQDNIALAGYIDDADLPLVFRAADLSVVPSLMYEGFGLAAAESLAAGTPALVTDVGGLPEIIGSLSPQLIVKPESAPALSSRLDQFLSGRLRIPTEAECRHHAIQYSWRTVTDQILDVYGEAAGWPRQSNIVVKSNDRVLEPANVG